MNVNGSGSALVVELGHADVSLDLKSHNLRLADGGVEELGVVVVEATADTVLLVGLAGLGGKGVGLLDRTGRDGLVLADELLTGLLVDGTEEVEEARRDTLAAWALVS